MSRENSTFNIIGFADNAKVTAIYPREDRAVARRYVRFGLLGEAGELLNKLKKVDRGDYTLEFIGPELVKECGDMLWYLGMFTIEYSEVFYPSNRLGVVAIEYEKDKPLADTMIAADWLCMYAGNLHESGLLIDSSVPNNVHQVIEDEWENIVNGIKYAVRCIDWIARNFGSDIWTVADDNIRKLLSRKDRGALKGSGDNR